VFSNKSGYLVFINLDPNNFLRQIPDNRTSRRQATDYKLVYIAY
jgi:hypothetical protein